MEDDEYAHNRWIFIEPCKQYKGVVLITYEKGNEKIGHFKGIKCRGNHYLGTNLVFDGEENSEEDKRKKQETMKLRVMVMNCRSIREYWKKIMLIDILRTKEIDIAFLQETFLIKTERLYIQGYKIYKTDYNQRRKGVAILINTNINMEAHKILEDPDGRYVKVKLIDRETKDSYTIASVYVEPSIQDKCALFQF